MKTLVTKQDWIDALTRAKAVALALYPNVNCIYLGCKGNGIRWIVHPINCKFKNAENYFYSSYWMSLKKPTKKQVAAVFDNSIQLIKEM